MIKSRFMPRRAVPSIATGKTTPVTTNFAKGINTYAANDAVDAQELMLARDARFDRVGEYKTRKGLTKLSDPVGKEKVFGNFVGSYTEMTPIEEVAPLEVQIASDKTAGKVICGAKVRVRGEDREYGVLQIRILNAIGTSPIAVSCIDPKRITSEEQDIEVDFVQAPEVQNGKIFIEIATQSATSKKFEVGTFNGRLMIELYMAEKGRITSIYEANISNTTNTKTDKSILFTFAKDGSDSEILYRRAENGEISQLATLETKGKPVRYSQEASVVRCVFGKAPMTLNPTDLTGEIGWEAKDIKTVDLATNTDLEIKVSNIINGTQDNLLYFDADTSTQAVWTYPYGFNHKDNVINSFDKFDRDFRQNFPSINTGDPLTAAFMIGATVFVLTRKHKYQILFDTVESWNQDACAANGGTFSQESVVVGTDYAYFANEDGIFVFDGYSEDSITKNKIQNIYDEIENKEEIRLEIHGNRLYVLCPNKEAGKAGKILVYNLKLRLWESFDSEMYVSSMFARKSPSRRFLCGHNRMGMLMVAEDQKNNYDDLGAPLRFELRTGYLHYGVPGQVKRVSKWRPEFASTKYPYSVRCGYALDLTDDVRYSHLVNLQDRYQSGGATSWEYPDGVIAIDNVENRLTRLPRVNGQFRRCQIRYQHIAAFEPVTFRSHTLTIQIQRLR